MAYSAVLRPHVIKFIDWPSPILSDTRHRNFAPLGESAEAVQNASGPVPTHLDA